LHEVQALVVSWVLVASVLGAVWLVPSLFRLSLSFF
jgi:hypothetical protein